MCMKLCSKGTPDIDTAGGGPLGDSIDLLTSGQLGENYLVNERSKSLSYFQFDETSLEVSKQIDDDQ